MSSRIYLDNNSSTPLDPLVKAYLVELVETLQGNPSSIHQQGKKIRSLLIQARGTVASFLGIKSSELLFTSGGTESANLAIRGIMGNFVSGHIVTSSVEHSCVFSTVKQYEATYLNPGAYGAIKPEQVEQAIRPDTKLVAIMAANNETGVITDIAAIAKIAKQRGIPFFVDATAILGKESFIIPDGVSLLSFSGHKIHALQGVGGLFVRAGTKLIPQITGGEQEFGKRAGTENILGILSLGKAISLLKENLSERVLYIKNLRNKFEEQILCTIPGVQVNGEGSRISNVSNLYFPGVDGESMLIALDTAGISASHGSACSSGATEPSRVLLNMGLSAERAKNSIRFSFSYLNSVDEIEKAVKTINSLF